MSNKKTAAGGAVSGERAPQFVRSVVQLIAHLDLSNQINPEMLRSAKNGKTDAAVINELWGMIHRFHSTRELSCPQALHPQLIVNTTSKPSQIMLLVLTWLIVQQQSWKNCLLRRMLSDDISSQQRMNFQLTSTIVSQLNCMNMNIVITQYNTLLQKLRQFYQLDTARVRHRDGIVRLLLQLNRITSDTEAASAWQQMNNHELCRIIDNLWRGALLLNPLNTSNTRNVQAMIDQAAPPLIDEAAFLRWVSSSISFDHKSNTSEDNQKKEEEVLLEEEISKAVDVMAILEEKSLQIITSERSMSSMELEQIFTSVDEHLETQHLSVEEIDQYLYEDNENDVELKVEYNDYNELLDSNEKHFKESYASIHLHSEDFHLYFDSLQSSSLYIHHDHEDELYQYLQNICPINISNHMEEELINLRQVHQHTLQRTANACKKFCPYDITFKS